MGLDKRKCRIVFGIAVLITMMAFIYFGYIKCGDLSRFECALTDSSPRPPIVQVDRGGVSSVQRLGQSEPPTNSVSLNVSDHIQFNDEDLDRDYDLDLEQADVLVFLHMQKTGGTTFGRHLVKNLDIEPPCKCYRGRKKCDCLTKGKHVWLFSRFSTGWVCGLHADWTELTGCVDKAMTNKLEKVYRKRKYHFITIIRQPVYRFLSEWKHVQRGATWKSARLVCNGREATLDEVPFCFDGEDWSGVSLDLFISCEHNLAFNRQTRMLANLTKVNCYNQTSLPLWQRKKILLDSAKENLKNMAFFGLLEYQNYTQFLFEHTFNLEFIDDFEQYDRTHSSKATKKLSAAQFKQIKKVNDLDLELYQYAKELLFQRLYATHKEIGSSVTSVKELEDENEQYYYDDGDDDDTDSEDENVK